MKNVQIGILIRKLRKELNMSMIDFASSINISQPSLSRIESGSQEVTVTILEAICLKCSITISEFFLLLEKEVDLNLDKLDSISKIPPTETIESELINLVKELSQDQQKALYILLLPFLKV